MFEVLKSKLSAVEAAVRAASGEVKAAATKVETEVKGLDKLVTAPIDQAAAAATKAKTDVTSTLAPLKTKASQLAPPGG